MAAVIAAAEEVVVAVTGVAAVAGTVVIAAIEIGTEPLLQPFFSRGAELKFRAFCIPRLCGAA